MALRHSASSLLRQLAAAPLESSLGVQTADLLGCVGAGAGVQQAQLCVLFR